LTHENCSNQLKEAIDSSLEDYENEELKRKVSHKMPSLEKAKMERHTNPTNNFSEPQLFYRLNYLPKFSTKANEETIKITDIIQESAQKVVLTTYKLELDWLFTVCPVLTSVPVFISHGEESENLPKSLTPRIKLSKPRTNISYSTNHGKIFLVEYVDRLRIAISTANLIEVDYTHKTQGLWVQDFPRFQMRDNNGAIAITKKPSNSIGEDFKETLQDYLDRLGIDKNWIELHKYDFSRVRVILISSVPGYHKGATMHNYGHLKLRRILGQEKFDSLYKHSSYICQISSIGSLSDKWIREFLQSISSCAGYTLHSQNLTEDGSDYFIESSQNNEGVQSENRNDRSKKSQKSLKKVTSADKEEKDFKIIWPTVEFVRESIDGYMSGASLCFSQKNLKPLLMKYFHHYIPWQPGRNKIPPHIKTLTRANNENLAWVLLTSANLSKAAWGELQKNETQLLIRNFEIGVLFLPSLAEQHDDGTAPFIATTDHNNSAITNVTQTPAVPNKPRKYTIKYRADAIPSIVSVREDSKIITFPMPYVIPPKKYEQNDKPWVWDVPYTEFDVLGNTWL
jgi:tyrosyl-DNA phosphodiesterase-1